MYFDENELIVQKDFDGGDTASREGDYWFAKALNQSVPNRELVFSEVTHRLQPTYGTFVRNPINYNNPKDFSRDQTVPLILALGENTEYGLLKLLFKKQVKNYFRYQNGDIGSFEDLNYYIRAFNKWYLWPLLIPGDVQMLGNTFIRLVKGFDSNDVSDDINHTLVLIQAQKHLPTPISYLARKLYKLVPGGIQSRWSWYFRPETGANRFDLIYENLINEM